MFKELIPAFRLTALLTVLTGLVYPGVVTALCQALFPAQANGSLVTRNGRLIGSSLIAQNFATPAYFHPRPSAANFDAALSSGSNLGPTSAKLVDRIKAARAAAPAGPLPADLLTTSASGLDPHISPASAHLQAARIAQARRTSPASIAQLIDAHTEARDLGFLGEPRANVLLLNLALDARYPVSK